MHRVPEPELMTDEDQALAYAAADFAEPHGRFVELVREKIGEDAGSGTVLDLGCGPADVTIRFARAFSGTTVHGIDGSAPMLRLGREALARAHLSNRVELFEGRLPGASLPHATYAGIISNALLHHLLDPMSLWDTVRKASTSGSWVFVMDLLRPCDTARAKRLVDLYAACEPDVLRRDFYNSLLAAYEPNEVRTQLDVAGLDQLVIEVVSDRHWIVWGRFD